MATNPEYLIYTKSETYRLNGTPAGPHTYVARRDGRGDHLTGRWTDTGTAIDGLDRCGVAWLVVPNDPPVRAPIKNGSGA